jgi:ABC-type sugar transport system ATPase subunit
LGQAGLDGPHHRHAQRWRTGRASYRPAGEPLNTRAYEVASIKGDAIARAFVTRPALLFADEPTAALDLATAKVVVELLRAYAHEGGTVLLVTHDTRLSSAFDRAYAMDDGHVETKPSETVQVHNASISSTDRSVSGPRRDRG